MLLHTKHEALLDQDIQLYLENPTSINTVHHTCFVSSVFAHYLHLQVTASDYYPYHFFDAVEQKEPPFPQTTSTTTADAISMAILCCSDLDW